MVRAPYGLSFETFSPVERSEHLRADVALFVGFVEARHPGELPDFEREQHLRTWLELFGFGARVEELARSRRSVASLLDIPVPVESWGTFDQLFAWDRRPIQEGVFATSYLGAAVRAFFAQGGRKAYVVRVGSPWMKRAQRSEDAVTRETRREERLEKLVPDRQRGRAPEPADRSTWRGIGHLFGLPDVSFVLLPDLPDVLDAISLAAPVIEPVAATEEVFVTCSDEVAEAGARDALMSQVPPPACDELSLARWAEVVSAAVRFLRRYRNEAELVAAIPLVLEDATKASARLSTKNPLGRFYEEKWLGPSRSAGEGGAVDGFTSAFLQLATPWIKTLGSSKSPGEIEPPDGTLAGVLARNALTRGTFRSAAGLPVPFVFDFVPSYSRATLLEAIEAGGLERRAALSLLQRVSVLGRAPSGIQLLSDVTTSADESYRSAGASRIVGAVLRAARAIGEEMAFEVSNEALWARVRGRFQAMLRELWGLGALRGRTAADAFQVRCDRTTMTQSDIDAGRVIVRVQLEVAVAIEAIAIVLALTEGGRVALLSMSAQGGVS
jgi:hypothetical protein